MKKVLITILVLAMLLVFAGCEESHEHSYSAKITKQATCTEEGVRTYSCSCGGSYTEAVAELGHTWSSWTVENKALIGKPGSEKRTCSVCAATEEQERTANAIPNSFYDGGIQYIVANSAGNLTASALLDYARHEFHQHLHHDVSAATIFDALAEIFELTDDLKADMIDLGKSLAQYEGNIYGYNEANDTFHLQYAAETSDFGLLGYVFNSDNIYTAYFYFEYFDDGYNLEGREGIWKVELQYNKADGKPNKYLSFEKVEQVPEDMVQCPEGEYSEFIG